MGGNRGILYEERLQAISRRLADLSTSRQERAKITQVPVVTILSVLNLILDLGAHPLPQKQAFRWQLNL